MDPGHGPPCSSLHPLYHGEDEALALASPMSSRHEVQDPPHPDRAAVSRHHHVNPAASSAIDDVHTDGHAPPTPPPLPPSLGYMEDV
ncbi:hypothetical protein ACQJBY_063422 [Aegilops geniculata]